MKTVRCRRELVELINLIMVKYFGGYTNYMVYEQLRLDDQEVRDALKLGELPIDLINNLIQNEILRYEDYTLSITHPILLQLTIDKINDTSSLHQFLIKHQISHLSFINYFYKCEEDDTITELLKSHKFYPSAQDLLFEDGIISKPKVNRNTPQLAFTPPPSHDEDYFEEEDKEVIEAEKLLTRLQSKIDQAEDKKERLNFKLAEIQELIKSESEEFRVVKYSTMLAERKLDRLRNKTVKVIDKFKGIRKERRRVLIEVKKAEGYRDKLESTTESIKKSEEDLRIRLLKIKRMEKSIEVKKMKADQELRAKIDHINKRLTSSAIMKEGTIIRNIRKRIANSLHDNIINEEVSEYVDTVLLEISDTNKALLRRRKSDRGQEVKTTTIDLSIPQPTSPQLDYLYEEAKHVAVSLSKRRKLYKTLDLITPSSHDLVVIGKIVQRHLITDEVYKKFMMAYGSTSRFIDEMMTDPLDQTRIPVKKIPCGVSKNLSVNSASLRAFFRYKSFSYYLFSLITNLSIIPLSKIPPVLAKELHLNPEIRKLYNTIHSIEE